MKTAIIPAQITTVEDKIAGSLNLTQVVLLVLALISTVLVYAIFPPTFRFTYYKIPLMVASPSSFLILALRIRGKVLLEWLIVLLRYNLRPQYYLFNKNTMYLRDIVIPENPKETASKALKLKEEAAQVNNRKNMSIKDLIKLEQLIADPSYTVSYKFGKKGGFNVGFSEVKE